VSEIADFAKRCKKSRAFVAAMRQTLGPLMRLKYRAGEKKKADRGKELAPRCDMTRSKNLML